LKRLFLLAALVVGLGAVFFIWETEPPWFERLRYPLNYQAIIRTHAHTYGIDPALLAAVIYQESKFDPTARSKSGAVGLMQLTPTTAEGIAIRTGGRAFRVGDLTTPELNVRYGCWYLRDLFNKYKQERLVLAAYNAGQGNVDRWLNAHEGIQFAETRAYVSRVEHLQGVYRDAWHSKLYS
jgi:soluble lytic murein transglycosylase